MTCLKNCLPSLSDLRTSFELRAETTQVSLPAGEGRDHSWCWEELCGEQEWASVAAEIVGVLPIMAT